MRTESRIRENFDQGLHDGSVTPSRRPALKKVLSVTVPRSNWGPFRVCLGAITYGISNIA